MADDTGLVFRPADRSDDESFRRLNAEVFPANPKTRPEITRWQWWDNPFGETIAYVWADEDDGTVVGQYLAYRMPGMLDGRPGRFSIGVDVAIARTHQGRGLFKALLDGVFGQATAEDTPCFSYPNEQSVRGAVAAGLCEVDQLRVRVLPLDDEWLAGRAHVPRAVAGLARKAVTGRRRTPGDLSVATPGEVPDDIDGLWAAVRHDHPWGVARHGGWWRWRYDQHPDRPYRLVTVRRSGTLVAAAAVRTRDDLGGRFHCLLELLATDDDAARAVVTAIIDGAVDTHPTVLAPGSPAGHREEGYQNGRADGIALTTVPGSRLDHLGSAAGLWTIPGRLLPRPVHFGVVPHPTLIPDPSAVPWSTSWGDLDHI